MKFDKNREYPKAKNKIQIIRIIYKKCNQTYFKFLIRTI